MKKLFLAVIDLRISDYMADSRTETITTLVWGADTDDARATIEREYDVEDSYSTNRYPENIRLTEALGSPIAHE